MIKDIRIANFKRIDSLGVELEELAPINYLVGENGCGKSSILEAIQYFCISKSDNIVKYKSDLCEILEIQNQSKVPLSESGGMFHPQGKIALCFRNVDDEQNQYPTQAVIIRIDGAFYLDQKLEDLEHFLLRKGVINLTQKVDFKQTYLEFITNRLTTKRELFLSDLIYINHLLPTAQTYSHEYQKLLKFLRHLLRSPNDNGQNQPQDQESDEEILGKEMLTKLAVGILFLQRVFKIRLFMLEEPENHLHPQWQKKLAYLFEYFYDQHQLQFLITTHSPFLISSSSQLTQETKEKSQLIDAEFEPPQKVYFLKDGKIASKRGEIELDANGHQKGRFGYWGVKCVYISAKMLGAGLLDLISPQKALKSMNAPEIILCEGEGDDEDAVLYNIIFRDLNSPVIFISSRGSSQLFRTFSILKEIKKGIAANFQLKMLRDRDHDFPNYDSIQKFERENQGIKILRKRAIECYLYNSETIKLWFKSKHKQNYLPPDPELLREMDLLQAQIQSEAEQGIKGNDYKTRLKDLFDSSIGASYQPKYEDFGNPDPAPDTRESIAHLITPETQTYQELFEIIFKKELPQSATQKTP